MREFIIILGREPELSVAELAATASRFGTPLSFSFIGNSFVQAKGELSHSFMEALAGTVKIAELLGEVRADKVSLVDFIKKILPQGERCEFGISWHGDHTPKWLAAAGMEIKNHFKSEGQHIRFVTSRTPALSSVVVTKNKLLPPRGYEFILIPHESIIVVSRTVWVQDFASWSQRDYGRPERDARVGMLPPKLARLMVNLAQAPEGSGILDPFCGSGTVLQEAALLGYRHLVGVDVDSQGIDRTRKNFIWLKQQQPQLTEPALMVADINKISTVLNNSTFAAVVTEPYLGPPLRGHESQSHLEQIHRELTQFYKDTLKALTKVVKQEGRVVMVWPVLRVGNKNITLPLLNEAKEFGLMPIKLLPSQAPTDWHNDRGTLWYFRPDARVIREIVVLQKK